MKVLVVGATGFIGSCIAEVLQQADHKVIGLARSAVSANQLRKRNISVHMGDLNDPNTLLLAFKEVDAVIQATNVDNDCKVAKALIDSLSESKKTLIFTSGSNVYGGNGDEPVDETIQPESGHMYDYEKLILSSSNNGLRTIIIRPTLVYGRSGSPTFIHAFLNVAKEAGESYYVGDGHIRISTIHVEDLAELYLRALEKAPNKSVFNASAEPIYLKELAEAISFSVGLNGQTKSLPAVKESDYVWPRASWSLTRQHLVSAQALKLLDWKARRPSIISELRSGNY